MASREITGRTVRGVAERHRRWEKRHRYDDYPPFQEAFCLAPIGKQPDHYDGPQRYCMSTNTKEIGSKTRCKFHGGASNGFSDGDRQDPALASMTHGMTALRENLIKDFDEKDQALYDWIIDSYKEAYDLTLQGDPQTALDLHRLAAEVVRAERGRGHLIREGEVHEEEVYGEDGVVIDENGEIATQKSEHYLSQMLHRQDKKLTQLAKEMGVTRKERQRQDSTDSAVEAIKDFAEIGSAIIDRDSKDFDADNDAPWEDDNESAN